MAGFLNTKTKLETSIYKLQCSGVFMYSLHPDPWTRLGSKASVLGPLGRAEPYGSGGHGGHAHLTLGHPGTEGGGSDP